MASATISCSGRPGNTVTVPHSGGTYTLNFRVSGKAPNAGTLAYKVWGVTSRTNGITYTLSGGVQNVAVDGTVTATKTITVTFPSRDSIGPVASITFNNYCYEKNSKGVTMSSAEDILTLKFLTATTSVSPSVVSLNWTSGTFALSVSDSGGATVAVTSMPSWITQTGNYTFEYKENTSGLERTGSIQLRGSSTVSVQITQIKSPGLVAGQSSAFIPQTGGSVTIPIIVNGNVGSIGFMDMSDVGDGAGWLTKSMQGTNLVVSATRWGQRTSSSRVAYVGLYGSNAGNCFVKVVQAAPTFVRVTNFTEYGDLVATPSESWITIDNTSRSITSSGSGTKTGKVNFNYADLPPNASADLTVDLSR